MSLEQFLASTIKGHFIYAIKAKQGEELAMTLFTKLVKAMVVTTSSSQSFVEEKSLVSMSL